MAPIWMREVTDQSELQQGDILLSHDLATPRRENDAWKLSVTTLNVIVLTQSCDIPKGAQTSLLVAAVHPYEYVIGKWPQYRQAAYRTNLVRQQSIPDFLLPPCPGSLDEWSVVSFRHLFSVPKQDAVHARRLELMSPYREALAQAYGRFMMRVGLPEGLQESESELPS